MAASQKRPTATLFNNPMLSDLVIKQTAGGYTREFFAHKAIICGDSRYFLRAFTGNFIEAKESTMELYGDDPDHFEFLLQYLYTGVYDRDAVTTLAAGDPLKRIAMPIGVYVTADKYDVTSIHAAITQDVEQLLANEETLTLELLQVAVDAHYGGGSAGAGSTLGKLITKSILNTMPEFVESVMFVRLLQNQPAFGADVALAIRPTMSHFTARTYLCSVCNYNGLVVPANLKRPKSFYCTSCGKVQPRANCR